MVEKTLVIDGLELNYKGLFDVNGLLKKIDKNIGARGYSKGEKRREEKNMKGEKKNPGLHK